jgi:hypothetical protein
MRMKMAFADYETTIPYLRHLGGAARTICSFQEKLHCTSSMILEQNGYSQILGAWWAWGDAWRLAGN